jgi:hypothetical protein
MSEWVRPWLSPEDLAAELDVPLRSVYVWNHRGPDRPPPRSASTSGTPAKP